VPGMEGHILAFLLLTGLNFVRSWIWLLWKNPS